ncbi:outer membrane beta-barrel protein [Aureispira sp. CCB-QB1]|uniref:outer membrane beta-barrel protein n=1 Tax=Aureispira sp. CCB-QB1 TaxID=1313421 RepID=UPI0012DC7F7E|nr:outer membrane beta-barrel protein [Aureispira sp. CCB-QB1]
MRNIFLLFFITSYFVANSQHQISIHGGWTASKIVEFRKPSIPTGSSYDDLHAFPMHHGVYGSIEYEYMLHPFKLSIGVSASEFGTSKYIVGPWATYYISIPMMLGYHWSLPKNFGVTLEGGAEIGIETSSTVFNYNKSQVLALGTVGIEAAWKRLKFGVKGHFSLNPFRDWNTAYLHHSGITTYIGYTLFDSAQNKKRRAKHLEQKESKTPNDLLKSE